jgi:hypothetical protein
MPDLGQTGRVPRRGWLEHVDRAVPILDALPWIVDVEAVVPDRS